MGFLAYGEPLSWEASKPFHRKVKCDGLIQLLHIWNQNKNREDIDLKWGDEMEYQLIRFDHQNETAKLFVDGPAILAELAERERKTDWTDQERLVDTMSLLSGRKSVILRGAEWHPEFGSHMIEATPNPPFELSVDSFLDVEDSLMSRRFKLQSILPEDTYVASIASYPRFGVGNFICSDQQQPKIETKRHIGVPAQLVNPHPRFPTLVANVVARRGRNLEVLIPVLDDTHTKDSKIWDNSLVLEEGDFAEKRSQVAQNIPNPVRDKIHMDSFGFGMSLSCLQVTFGTPNIRSARNLYDQQAVLAPIFLALSAATPFLRGFLSGVDTRWKVLEGTCDSRTEGEMATVKSRFGGVSLFIGQEYFFQTYQDELNDKTIAINEEAYTFLRQNDMDPVLARHFALMWLQDPLVMFDDKIHLNNKLSVDHFENIQSTNWNSVRFKPPPPSHDGNRPSDIGWRVELRTPDIQLTDFENAALCCFASLLALAVLRYNLNLYIPMSKCEENLETSHITDSITKRCFWFRHDVGKNETTPAESPTPLSKMYSKMTLREIFLGCRRTGMIGLIPLMDQVVSDEWRHQRCSRDAVEKYRTYANFIRQRVLGQAWSDAKLMRHIVLTNPAYEGNSQISEKVNYDVCKYAVSGGFSLRPEISPWNLPGCIPSSTRLPVRTSCCPNLKSYPLVKALAKLPDTGSDKKGMDIFASSPHVNDPSHESLETRPCGVFCRDAGICDHVQPLPLTPADISHQEFDADLFLQMDQYSR